MLVAPLFYLEVDRCANTLSIGGGEGNSGKTLVNSCNMTYFSPTFLHFPKYLGALCPHAPRKHTSLEVCICISAYFYILLYVMKMLYCVSTTHFFNKKVV